MSSAIAKIESPLSELEIEAIDLFISFMKLVGLPKSVGEIYGLLFVSESPLNSDEITEHLQISSGAASQGLKILRAFGAVRAVYMPGDRRDHFVADLDLSTFAMAFLNDELKPRLENAAERIQRMENLVEAMDPQKREGASQRIERLKHWTDRGREMMPWIQKFLVK